MNNIKIEHALTELIPTKKRKESIFLFNVNSNPSQRNQKFKTLLHKASTAPGRNTMIVCGDFKAMDPTWGYDKSTVKGRNLAEYSTELDFTLITDPAHPTKIGNTVFRDTTPDLTFVTNDNPVTITWRNTGVDLGSDPTIVEVVIPERSGTNTRKHTWVDWKALRHVRSQNNEEGSEINDIETWTTEITKDVRNSTKEIETDIETNRMDSRLAHLIEAKQSIQNRWRNSVSIAS